MDFARKQLEKYGWSAGKGLGRHENGISEALKPKLKRSVSGVGHDPASDFTEHWWNDLYNKAAKNLEVEEVNGRTKKIKRKDNTTDFEITNCAWKINKQKNGRKCEEQYSNYFVKTAILGNGGCKVKNLKDSDPVDEETQNNVIKLTDEELFRACEGRTAHKGARHGLKALGKLARIEQQEKILLNQTKYIGYSHKKKGNTKNQLDNVDDQVVENNFLGSVVYSTPVNIKKKKKKHCHKDKIDKVDIKALVNSEETPKCVKNDTDMKTIKCNKKNKSKKINALDKHLLAKVEKNTKCMTNNEPLISSTCNKVKNVSLPKMKKKTKTNVDYINEINVDGIHTKCTDSDDVSIKKRKKK